jgi:hypothetical protein
MYGAIVTARSKTTDTGIDIERGKTHPMQDGQ